MTGSWMSSLDDPVDIVCNVGEERTLITCFKVLENIVNLRKG
jgi:hypothetical protein